MTLLKYFLGWFGMMGLAVLNGGLRDSLYQPVIGELAAHQVSTLCLLFLLGVYLGWLTRIWPLGSLRTAWMVGGMWLAMTLAFEIGLGRFLLGYPWSRISHDYNLLAGRIWILVPVLTLVGPVLFARRTLHRP